MSEILSQAEIEGLLNSLNSGEPEPGPIMQDPQKEQVGATGGSFVRKKSTKSAVSFEVYDFRRPDKFSKDQLRTLQMLHETFARLSASSLSAYLRTPVSIDLISLEQVPYEEYLRTINQSVFTVMSLPPLTGQAVLEVEFSLIFSIIDRMLGGSGQSFNRNSLTDIERPLIRQVIERVFAGLKSAWEGVVIVNPGIEGIETSAQFVQIAPPSDVVVTILFEVKVGNQRGAMSLCIPYLVLKPITAKLSAQKWFAAGNKRQTNQARKLLTYQINHTVVDCSVELGNATMLLKDFIRLRKGDMLRLDKKSDDELTLKVGGMPKYIGKLAKNGKNLILNVTSPWEE